MFYRNMALSKSENSGIMKEFETYNAAFMGNYCVTNIFVVILQIVMWHIILASLISVGCEGSTGVNFIPQNSFYSTYSMWALTFSIDLSSCFENVHQINCKMVNVNLLNIIKIITIL